MGLFRQYFFFSRGTFHNMFQTRHTCTYGSIGTSEKKMLKPPWGGFSKSHCREFFRLKSNFEHKKTNQTCTIHRGYEICHTNFTSTQLLDVNWRPHIVNTFFLFVYTNYSIYNTLCCSQKGCISRVECIYKYFSFKLNIRLHSSL